MSKVLFIGGIALNEEKKMGGELVKNRNFKQFLENKKVEFEYIDTYGWEKNVVKISFLILKYILYYKIRKVVISISSFSAYKLIILFKKLFFLHKIEIYYFVIGGNLHNIIKDNNYKIKYYKSLKKIYVETLGLKEKLDFLNSNNIEVIPNFRNFRYKPENINYQDDIIKCVYFGKISEEKGIKFVIENLKSINEELKIDFYGPIEDNFKKYFFDNIDNKRFFYKGILNLNNESNYAILSSYKLFIFPTYWSGEGFPGVIIDAYISGLPVLASDWKYNSELIENDINGFLFKVNDSIDFIEKIMYIKNNYKKLELIRNNNLEKAKLFLSENCLEDFLRNIFKY